MSYYRRAGSHSGFPLRSKLTLVRPFASVEREGP
jgi:hypothetical protein